MNSDKEFVVGQHGIGWIDSDFKKRFGNVEFSERSTPTFQKLGKSMSDKQIERDLKPGLCELGDVVAFMDNAPEECKDGWSNIFYTEKFVVSVYCYGTYGPWGVCTWPRDSYGWGAGPRVFSPATSAVSLGPKSLEYSDSSSLPGTLNINGTVYTKHCPVCNK